MTLCGHRNGARADEASTERARFADTIDAQQAELRKLQVRAERAREEYAKLLDAGDDLAPAALREAARMDRDAEGLQEALHAAQQRLEEWRAPKVNALLDFYAELRDVIDGRIRAAQSARDVNAALRTMLDGAWLHADEKSLHGRFVVRTDTPGGTAFQLRTPLPVDAEPVVIPARQTGPQPFLKVPVCHGIPIPPLEVEIRV